MKTAAEINSEYKENKRIEKIKIKQERDIQKSFNFMNKSIEKHKVSLEQKKQIAIEKYKVDITSRYEKQHARFEKQRQKTLDRNIRKIQGKKPLKKNVAIVKRKQKAFSEIQGYSKLSRANKD
jgi:hypothetical protein